MRAALTAGGAPGGAVAGSAVPACAVVNGALGRRDGIFDHRSRLDQEHPAIDETRGHGVPGAREDARVGLARHPHALGCRILVEPLEIAKADGLEFVEADHHRVGPARGPADGTKAPARQAAADTTGDQRTRHW
jgi:hypothetical protein